MKHNTTIINMSGNDKCLRELILKIDSEAEIKFGYDCKCDGQDIRVKIICALDKAQKLKILDITCERVYEKGDTLYPKLMGK